MLGTACVNIAPSIADDSAAVRLETVIVEGRREAIWREAEVFVSSIVPDPWKPLARWRRPLCPLVAGATREQAEWMLLRLSEIARDSAVPLGRKDCKANQFVVLTHQPDLLLQRWRKRDPGMFGDAPPVRIERFLTGPRPARVWYTTERSTPAGLRLEGGERQHGGGLIVRDVNAWRLEWNVVPDIVQAVLVVDTTRTVQLRLRQLTDYVALVGMAATSTERTAARRRSSDSSSPVRLRTACQVDSAPGMPRFSPASTARPGSRPCRCGRSRRKSRMRRCDSPDATAVYPRAARPNLDRKWGHS